jgi:carbamoyltransferase
MKILGIHYGHNATIGLLQDGKVVFCQSEERLNRMKNSTGFPTKTLDYIKKTYGSDFDLVVFPQKTIGGYVYLKNQEAPAIRYQNYFSKVRPRNFSFVLRYLAATYVPRLTGAVAAWRSRRYESSLAKNVALEREARSYFAGQVGVSEEKLRFLDHHQSHALSLGFLLRAEVPHLIFTLE